MAVNKNLFLYNLAVVTMIKNEGAYVKEWLDYHLLAGADHFYIYDNESTDDTKEILQPYIKAGVVSYTSYPGKARQCEIYTDAVQNYKFFCRYMAFIDTDEFIFPQNDKSIAEVADEILKDKSNAAGIGVNSADYTENNSETAEDSKSVLEKFTLKITTFNTTIKTIANPRRIDFFYNPNFPVYFKPFHAVGETGQEIQNAFNPTATADKICINHCIRKTGEAAGVVDDLEKLLNQQNKNVDDSILKYRDARQEIIFKGKNKKKTLLELLPKENSMTKINRVKVAAAENISNTLKNLQPEFFVGKIDTYLICRELVEKFKIKIGNLPVEEISLLAVHQASIRIKEDYEFAVLLSALPNILKINNPTVKAIADFCFEIIPTHIDSFRNDDKANWQKIADLKYIQKILEIFKSKEHK